MSRLLPAVLVFALTRAATAADAYTLEEPPTDSRPRQVSVQVAITGRVMTNAAPGEIVKHDLNAEAAYAFRERRLKGAGRDAAAYRCVREFERATARTKIGDRVSTSSLPAAQRIIAVHGRREGMLRYCPSAMMTRESLDLIDLPGDSLAALALLPERPVEVGEEWTVPDWSVQMLTAVEAVLECELKCTLAEVTGRDARARFTGRIEGARLGAHTEIDLSGEFVYDLKDRIIRRIELKHEETTSIGTVNPGIESQVRVTLERSLAAGGGRLTDELARALPLDPPSDRLPLVFDAAPWGLRLTHDRGWHVFHANFEQDRPVVILRLIDRGSLICQCNVSPLPSVEAGRHTPLNAYEESIARSLGGKLAGFIDRGEVPTGDGRTIHRVVAQGHVPLSDDESAEPLEMHWVYYLVTHPSGRQASFVFALEPEQYERLAERDVQMVRSLRFLGPPDRQASAR